MIFKNIKDNIDHILSFYPKEFRPLILHQIMTTISFIEEERESYLKNPEVMRILDKLLSQVVEGKLLLGVELNDK